MCVWVFINSPMQKDTEDLLVRKKTEIKLECEMRERAKRAEETREKRRESSYSRDYILRNIQKTLHAKNNSIFQVIYFFFPREI